MARREGFITVIADTVVIFKQDLTYLAKGEKILPDIVRSDEPDRGEIETSIESRGEYPRLVKKDLSIERTIGNINPVVRAGREIARF